MITTIMAAFAFGYCVMNIILTRRERNRLDEMFKNINKSLND